MRKTIHRLDLVNKIISTHARVSVCFTKKNGVKRTVVGNCRRKCIQDQIRNTNANTNPLAKGLLPIFDSVNDGYRTINVATIEKAEIGNTVYIVTG